MSTRSTRVASFSRFTFRRERINNQVDHTWIYRAPRIFTPFGAARHDTLLILTWSWWLVKDKTGPKPYPY